MKVSICIVTCNRPVSLKRTVSSILNSSKNTEFEILLIDNSDSDKYSMNDSLCALNSKIRHILSDSKIGIAGLRQIGVEKSNGEIIAFVDDDIAVPDEWLSEMVAAFQSDPKLGICGCKIQNIGFDGKVFGYEMHGAASKHGTNGAFKPAERDDEIVTFGEANLVLRREFVLKTGGFDKRFKWGYEGSDLVTRMLSIGCTLKYVKNVTIYHYYSEKRFRPFIDKTEYYRYLFFFKNMPRKNFSLVYEIKRMYYSIMMRNFPRAISIFFLLLALPYFYLVIQPSK